MNLQKLQTQREANRKTTDRYVEKLEETREQNLRTEFKTTFRSLEKKVRALDTLNEKVIGQIDVENMEAEILENDEYILKLELKLEVLKQYKEEELRPNQGKVTYFMHGVHIMSIFRQILSLVYH